MPPIFRQTTRKPAEREPVSAARRRAGRRLLARRNAAAARRYLRFHPAERVADTQDHPLDLRRSPQDTQAPLHRVRIRDYRLDRRGRLLPAVSDPPCPVSYTHLTLPTIYSV